MDTLVSQRACKSATLHLLSGSVSGDEQLADLFPLLLSLLVPPTDHSIHQQQCSVLVGTILQSLCDQVKLEVHKFKKEKKSFNGKILKTVKLSSPGYFSRGVSTW